MGLFDTQPPQAQAPGSQDPQGIMAQMLAAAQQQQMGQAQGTPPPSDPQQILRQALQQQQQIPQSDPFAIQAEQQARADAQKQQAEEKFKAIMEAFQAEQARVKSERSKTPLDYQSELQRMSYGDKPPGMAKRILVAALTGHAPPDLRAAALDQFNKRQNQLNTDESINNRGILEQLKTYTQEYNKAPQNEAALANSATIRAKVLDSTQLAAVGKLVDISKAMSAGQLSAALAAEMSGKDMDTLGKTPMDQAMNIAKIRETDPAKAALIEQIWENQIKFKALAGAEAKGTSGGGGSTAKTTVLGGAQDLQGNPVDKVTIRQITKGGGPVAGGPNTSAISNQMAQLLGGGQPPVAAGGQQPTTPPQPNTPGQPGMPQTAQPPQAAAVVPPITKGDNWGGNAYGYKSANEAVLVDPNVLAMRAARPGNVFNKVANPADIRKSEQLSASSIDSSRTILDAANSGVLARVVGPANNPAAKLTGYINMAKATLGVGSSHPADPNQIQANWDKLVDTHQDDPEAEAFRQFLIKANVKNVSNYMNEVGGKRISNFELQFLQKIFATYSDPADMLLGFGTGSAVHAKTEQIAKKLNLNRGEMEQYLPAAEHIQNVITQSVLTQYKKTGKVNPDTTSMPEIVKAFQAEGIDLPRMGMKVAPTAPASKRLGQMVQGAKSQAEKKADIERFSGMSQFGPLAGQQD